MATRFSSPTFSSRNWTESPEPRCLSESIASTVGKASRFGTASRGNSCSAPSANSGCKFPEGINCPICRPPCPPRRRETCPTRTARQSPTRRNRPPAQAPSKRLPRRRPPPRRRGPRQPRRHLAERPPRHLTPAANRRRVNPRRPISMATTPCRSLARTASSRCRVTRISATTAATTAC